MAELSILDLLEPYRDSAWYPDIPASENEIAAAEAAVGHHFPEDYRLLALIGGGEIDGPESRVVLIPPKHLSQFNPEMERAPDLAELLIFADDGGDYFYFYDPKNLLGRGAWAVFTVEMSVAARKHAIFVARDFRWWNVLCSLQ